MKIINYDSELELRVKASKLNKTSFIVDSNISISFRLYDDKGNTTEYHTYKKHKFCGL